jgi:hypothetical protein
VSDKLNWLGWTELLRGDLEWLRAQPRTLERDHVIAIVEGLAQDGEPGSREYYDAQPSRHNRRRTP